MTKEEFEEIVRRGIERIPEKFLKRLENVDIIVEDEPTREQLKDLKKRNILLFGLYQGVPQTKRYHYGEILPDKITIFQKPIEEAARFRQGRGSPETVENEIIEIVKNTVWHEIAHHFGMTEEQIKKAEKIRQEKKLS